MGRDSLSPLMTPLAGELSNRRNFASLGAAAARGSCMRRSPFRSTLWRASPVLAIAFSTSVWAQGQPDVQTGCIVERVKVCDGCAQVRRAVVKRDGACSFEMSGGSLGSASVRISARPTNGILGKASGSALAYKPKPGFVGRDEFEIVGGWEQGGRNMSMTIRTRVTVVDGPLRW